MAKEYWFTFGSGNCADNTGLTPTLTIFGTISSTLSPAPTISEKAPATGAYYFQYTPLATLSIFFQIDGGAALADSNRYIQGVLDPLQILDQRIGTTSDSFGSTSVDPTTVFAYAKRQLEFNEGNAIFTKSTGVWDIYSRGSSTLLREKTLTNDSTDATKS